MTRRRAFLYGMLLMGILALAAVYLPDIAVCWTIG